MCYVSYMSRVNNVSLCELYSVRYKCTSSNKDYSDKINEELKKNIQKHI